MAHARGADAAQGQVVLADVNEVGLAQQGQIRPVPPGARAVPGWLRRVWQRGLMPDPMARFPSMAAVLVELARDPAAPRRRIAAVSAGVAVTCLATLALVRGDPTGEPPCQSARHELDGVWGPSRRAAIVAALGRDEVGARVGALFDDYAERWRAMRMEVCRATRVDGAQSTQVLDLRMGCLDRRRAQLDALSTVLGDGEREAVAHAVDAAFALPDLARCADVAALTAAVPRPDDPGLRTRVDAIERQLDHVSALQQAGLVPAALAEAQRVAAEARAIEYAPTRARALFLLGDLESDAGNGGVAEATLFGAAKAAAYAHDDHLLAEVYLALTWVIG